MSLHDDVLVELDLAMAVRRRGLPGAATPEGQLTRYIGTPLGRIIDVVNASTRPDVHRLGELVLGLSGNTASVLNVNIDKLVALAASDGCHHDFTIAVEGGGGLTIHCNALSEKDASEKLIRHCTIRKYTEESDRWYGIALSLAGRPRFMLGIEHPWESDPKLEKFAGDFRVRSVTHALNPNRSRVIRPNEKCPCGSGIKYKKCHGTER